MSRQPRQNRADKSNNSNAVYTEELNGQIHCVYINSPFGLHAGSYVPHDEIKLVTEYLALHKCIF